MTNSAATTTPATTITAPARLDVTEVMVHDAAEVLRWYGLSPHEADRAAREVLAAIALAGPAPADHTPAPAVAAPAPTHRHDRPTATGAVDVDLAGLTLPDPTARGARAIVKDRYGELVVDDGLRYRTPSEAETDGRALVASGRHADGLALIAAARHAHQLSSRKRRRRQPNR